MRELVFETMPSEDVDKHPTEIWREDDGTFTAVVLAIPRLVGEEVCQGHLNDECTHNVRLDERTGLVDVSVGGFEKESQAGEHVTTILIAMLGFLMTSGPEIHKNTQLIAEVVQRDFMEGNNEA